MLTSAALLPLCIWIYLLLARGGFWLPWRQLGARLPAPHDPAAAALRVIAVVPARDEADCIAAAVRSLLLQVHCGPLEVILVDDGSRDGTAACARAAAQELGAGERLTVLSGTPPPAGWSGKLWAMQQGVAAAQLRRPDYLLFTDADICHEAGSVAALVARSAAGQHDLVSWMVRLSVATPADRWLIPAFVFFFFMLYPPAWILRPGRRTAAAAGGCMLLRPAALERIGGLAVIRSALIDDCALARAVKSTGGSVWLGLTREARSLRPYGSLAGLGRMISRSAFNQLRHSWLLLLGTLAGLFLSFIAPPLLVLSGDPAARSFGLASWALMSAAYVPLLRFYGLSPVWAPTLPAIALFYAGATLHSALQYARGRGGRWKGRIQDARVSGRI